MQSLLAADPDGEMTISLVFMVAVVLYVFFGGKEEKK
jgi:hypothetical protein